MFEAILKATNSSFQKGITFCRSIYVKKVMKLLAFIFEQPSYYPSDTILIVYIFCNIRIGLYGTGTYITFYGCNVINGKSNSIVHVDI